MSSPCRRVEWSFSPAFEGSLSPSERGSFDAHLSACSDCREAFAKFVRSMSDLATLRPTGSVDDAFVAQLMSRVERAGTESGVGSISGVRPRFFSRWSFGSVLTHAAAAAVGIAATFACQFGSTRPEPAPGAGSPATDDSVTNARNDATSIGPISFVPRALPVRFEGDERAFEHNDRVERVTDSITLRPGETLRSLPSQRVAISLAETGELLIEIERTALDEPPKRVHEIKFVELPSLVTVDRALVDEAVDEFERRLVPRLGDLDLRNSMSAMMDAISRFDRAGVPSTPPMPEVEDAPLPESARDSVDSTNPESTVPLEVDGAFEPVTFYAGTSPTTIRRTPDYTTLSFQGSLATTIPELIALLTDEDPEIADLAAARLAAIREELELDPRFAGKLAPLPPATESSDRGETSRFAWLRNPFARENTVARTVAPIERWTRWWRENGLVIATGHRAIDR